MIEGKSASGALGSGIQYPPYEGVCRLPRHACERTLGRQPFILDPADQPLYATTAFSKGFLQPGRGSLQHGAYPVVTQPRRDDLPVIAEKVLAHGFEKMIVTDEVPGVRKHRSHGDRNTLAHIADHREGNSVGAFNALKEGNKGLRVLRGHLVVVQYDLGYAVQYAYQVRTCSVAGAVEMKNIAAVHSRWSAIAIPLPISLTTARGTP